MNVGTRVRMRHDPRIWDDPSVPNSIVGTVEVMAVGFDVRIEWDDGKRRGKYDGWVHRSSIEAID